MSEPDPHFTRALEGVRRIQEAAQRLPADQLTALVMMLEPRMPTGEDIEATRDLAALAGRVLTTQEPTRAWCKAADREQYADADKVAHIVAMLSLLEACPHVRADGRTLVADLRHSALCCQRCVLAAQRRPELGADVCDGCHRPKTRAFTTVVFGCLTTILLGDLCAECCMGLGAQLPREART